jgi:hypothetical protein
MHLLPLSVLLFAAIVLLPHAVLARMPAPNTVSIARIYQQQPKQFPHD